jgi:phosphoribosylglycinamide formyltransferase 1
MSAPPTTPLERPIRLGVLISGGGTTLLNLLDRIADGRLEAEVAVVLASRDCPGIDRARAAGLACDVVSRRSYGDVETFSAAVFEKLRAANVDLVVLAGFLSLLRLPDDFGFRVMNIHPGLIPAFCGTGFHGHRVHEAVLAYGAKVSGCTVHFADDTYDTGPVIAQRCVPVRDDDTPETLAARIFAAECEVYPEAIRLYAEGRLSLDGRRVRVRGDSNDAQ